jgi:hypothetical protein
MALMLPATTEPVPLVRCRLSGPDEDAARTLRYIPLAEFQLWKHLMESKHRRTVQVESVSIWIAEDAARWNSGWAEEDLEPVLRFQVEIEGPEGVAVPVERYFPAETYPEAQEALLAHYEGRRVPRRISAVPGYFVPYAESGRTMPGKVFPRGA